MRVSNSLPEMRIALIQSNNKELQTNIAKMDASWREGENTDDLVQRLLQNPELSCKKVMEELKNRKAAAQSQSVTNQSKKGSANQPQILSSDSEPQSPLYQ